MPPVGFETAISAVERLETYALDRAATGTGNFASAGLSNPSINGGFAIHSSTGHLMRGGEVVMNLKVKQEGGNSM